MNLNKIVQNCLYITMQKIENDDIPLYELMSRKARINYYRKIENDDIPLYELMSRKARINHYRKIILKETKKEIIISDSKKNRIVKIDNNPEVLIFI